MDQAIITKVLETSAGQLSILKSSQVTYYGLQPSINFTPHKIIFEQSKLKGNKLFRQYEEQRKIQNQEYYLFKHQQGTTIEQKISEARAKNQEINVGMINKYLPQLLQALYQLHQQNILGRVFSTSNILDCEDNGILMMDFGFGPAYYQKEIDILAPPEIIYQLCSQKEQQVKNGNSVLQDSCDLKIDSWLLGAFLFHIARSIPICSHQIYAKNPENVECFKYKDIEEYQNFLKLNKMLGFTGINYLSKSCSIDFCDLIEGLLQYDPDNRYSFSQIYKNNYVKSFNMQNYNDILKFYENFETNQKQISGLQPNPQVQFESVIYGISQYFVHRVQDIDNSRFKKIWYYFKMEQFKLFLLKDTLENIILFLDDNSKEIQHQSAYFLSKMMLFQLSNLINALEKQENPYKSTVDDNIFKKFLGLEETKIFIEELKIELVEEQKLLKQYILQFLDDFQQKKFFQEASKLDFKNIIHDIYDDSNFNMKEYQREIQKIFSRLYETQSMKQEYKDRQYELCLKLLICQDINVILNPEEIDNQFQSLRTQNEEIYWNQIYKYLQNKDNQIVEIHRLAQIYIKE